MKNLLIVLFVLSSLFSAAQPVATQPMGTPKTTLVQKGWLKNDSGITAVVMDTARVPVYLGEMRLRISGGDTSFFVAKSLTADKWMKLRPFTSGIGSGTVTSVAASIDGSVISVAGTPVTSTGTLAFTWNGAATDVTLGNGSYTPYSALITGITDPLYSPVGHTQTFSTITDGESAVRSLFTATAPLNYNSLTGNFSVSGTSGVQDGLVSGGVVTWSGTGLVFDVTAASYIISGSQYSSPTSQVTLDAADASFGRYDAIVVSTLGVASKLTGTPSASPVFPQTDPASEILLTYIFVDAGATTPTQVSNEVIYDENIEWTHSTSGSVTANFASTAFAQQGTKSIATTWTASSNLIFTNGATLSSGNYNTISFYVRLSGTLANNTNISLQFYNSTNAVSNSVTSSISKTTTGAWQLVSFNISQFSFTSTQFSSVRLILTGSTVSLAGTTTVYFDNIRLQAGITPPVTTQGLQSAYTKVTDGSTTAAATGSDQLKFRTDITLTAVVGSNDATHGDNVLFKVDTTKIATISYVTSHTATLQAVTDAGNSTTNTIIADKFELSSGGSDYAQLLKIWNAGLTGQGGSLQLKSTDAAKFANLFYSGVSVSPYFLLPETGNAVDTLATLYDIRTAISGGSTPGIDDVLAVGQSITANRTIVNGTHTLSITNTSLVGTGVELSAASSAASGNAQKLLSVSLSGVNSNSSEQTYVIVGNNQHTGTGSVNVGVYGIAENGDANFAVWGQANGANSAAIYGVNSGAGAAAKFTNSGGGLALLTTAGDVEFSNRVIIDAGVLTLDTQFTPSTSTDSAKPNKTLSADDTYLWYRNSSGTWKKIAWTAF